jgi:hypothetical protein
LFLKVENRRKSYIIIIKKKIIPQFVYVIILRDLIRERNEMVWFDNFQSMVGWSGWKEHGRRPDIPQCKVLNIEKVMEGDVWLCNHA